MSNSSINGKLKVLEERIENELRIQRGGGFPNQMVLGSPRPGGNRRPRPPNMFPSRDIPVFPPRNPQATETEHRMREVYKVSGKLNIDGSVHSSHIDDLVHQGELGSGTCGHVVRMLHKPSGAVIAVKQMRRSGNSEETKRILMDLDIVVRSHDCPYIVRCLGCFVTDADVWICMELMASCFDKLLKRLNAPIPEEILGKVTVATVNALSYLKDTHGVIHRDVKPSNILLDERGNIKLCDFGISGRLVDSKAKTRSAGCAAYMAPERIDPPDPTRPDYDIRADVWSLGISLVELATGVFPYRDCQNDFEVLTRVLADDPPQLPDGCDFTPEFKSFVSQCLTKNYRQRPKYAKLLEHPFVMNSAKSAVSVSEWYAALPATVPATPVKQVPRPSMPVPPIALAMTSSSLRPVEISAPRPAPAPARPAPAPAWSAPTPSPAPAWSAPAPSPAPAWSAPAPSPAPAWSAPAPASPRPAPRNFVTSVQHWLPEQITPTPHRARWGSSANAGGSSSQPASLEAEYYNNSPYPRRRTLEACASPPPPPARRVSADSRWRPSPVSSGNTSPLLLQRFNHQNQQRKSRVDLHSSPRHRSLSREGSVGRSPEPPPRAHRLQSHLLNGSVELEPPLLHERLHSPSPLLLHRDRLAEGRSQSLTRTDLRNGYRSELTAPVQAAPKLHHDDQGWLHSLAGLVKRRLSYVKWRHVAAPRRHPHLDHARWGNSESWSMPASPLPPRAPVVRRD